MVVERSHPNRITPLLHKEIKNCSPPYKRCLLAHPQFPWRTRRTLGSASMRSPSKRQSVQRRSDRGSRRKRPEGQRRLRGFGEKWRLKRPEKWQRQRRPGERPRRKGQLGKKLRNRKRPRCQQLGISSWSCFRSESLLHKLLGRRTLRGHQRPAESCCKVGSWEGEGTREGEGAREVHLYKLPEERHRVQVG